MTNILDFNRGSDFVYGKPYNPMPVEGAIAIPGTGKTREWRKRVAAPLVALGLHPALAIPRHQLGEEIVADFAEDGITAVCYRGREADDPLAPGHKMCREQRRIASVGEALADVYRHACKRGDKVCRYFEICGYQRQQREHPQVSIFAHQMLFQKRPDFIQPPDALGIDESFWDAGLRGHNKGKPERLWTSLLKDDRHVPGDIAGTADLIAISNRARAMLLRAPPGYIRRDAILKAGVTLKDVQAARQLEWRRKKDIPEVFPNMPVEQVDDICGAVSAHNQDVRRLVIFWDLLAKTLEGDTEHRPISTSTPPNAPA